MCLSGQNCHVLFLFYSFPPVSGIQLEKYKTHFFQNPRITKAPAVERDVKPRNMNFAKVERTLGD